jgi:hypothetical protein
VGFLAEHLPRGLAIALGIRRVAPGRCRPYRSVVVEPIDPDTGGAFRAAWREQDPAVDPREPNGGESSSTGTDHGWSNCTCTSGAIALAYQEPRGAVAPWGGDLRHRQGDLSGGTDLLDIRDAWSTYGETLTIRSGSGWSAVVTAHDEGRAIVIQGSGNVPGSESFDGGHACVIGPETSSSGSWLWGDPLASGWQWVSPSSVRSWAEQWQGSIAFAVGEKPSTSSSPTPPSTEPVCPPETPRGPELRRAEELGAELALDGEVATWLAWLGPVGGVVAPALWDASAWVGEELASLVDPCDNELTVWGRGPVPDPLAAAEHARRSSAAWDAEGWRSVTWR